MNEESVKSCKNCKYSTITETSYEWIELVCTKGEKGCLWHKIPNIKYCSDWEKKE